VRSILLKSILKLSLVAALLVFAVQLYANGSPCNMTGYESCMSSNCTPQMGRCTESCGNNPPAVEYEVLTAACWMTGDQWYCIVEQEPMYGPGNSCMQNCVNTINSCQNNCWGSYCT
jgi:hypothetical protein